MTAYRIVRYSGLFLPQEFRNLVLSRWKRSLRHGNDYYRLVQPAAYYEAYERYCQAILAHKDCAVRLAVLDDAPDVVLGFSVARGKILDYVHVHKDQRRIGIGTSLLPSEVATITHLTKTGLTIWGSKFSKWAFNPFV